MSYSQVIGEGTYGCVHKPQLYCKGEDTQIKNAVSKLMKKKVANQEFKEYNIIDKADPKNQYYLGIPSKCRAEYKKNRQGTYNKESAKKCKKLTDNDPKIEKHLDKYTLMIMENGGDNLEDFADKASNWNKNAESTKKMELFWIEAHRIFLGLKNFLDNGIIHHDLKAQNIVYNDTNGRINFIDFGLMKKKSYIITECKKSTYGFSVNHWSFPLETLFLNKKNYDYIFQLSNDDKIKFINKVISEFKQNKDKDIVNSIKNLLHSISNQNDKFLNLKEVFDACIKGYSETILHCFLKKPNNYKDFLNLCLDTMDIYGTGIGFLYVLKETHHHIDPAFADDLSKLFLNMINGNLLKRIKVEDALDAYEHILTNNGIMAKHNKHFFKNRLVDGLTVPVSVQNKIESVNTDSLYVTAEEMKDLLNKDENALDPKHNCVAGKEFNPLTKRCVKICKPGYSRDSNFHCKKNKTQKVAKPASGPKICPSGKELNPKTLRCVNVCKPGYSRDSKFHCKKNKTEKVAKIKPASGPKKCPLGKELNPKTLRCVNVCKSGYSRDSKFHCKKNKTQKIAKIKPVSGPKKCPLGKELNPKTLRCVNKCKPGYNRDKDFKCITDKTAIRRLQKPQK